MTKIIINEDCGNAPKKLFLKEFTVAIIKNKIAFISKNIIEDISWSIVGDEHFQGCENVVRELKKRRGSSIELTVDTIVTHGYNGTVNGLIKLKNGKRLAFCDVYTFAASTNNAKIKAICSYVIPTVT